MEAIMTAVAELTGAESIAWNLADLYAGTEDPALARDLDVCDARAEAFNTAYRGKVATFDAAALLTATQEYETITELAVKVGSFAQLQWTTNTNEPKYGALLQKLTERGAKIEQKLLFFMLEWIEVPDERAVQLIGDPALAHYRHFFEAERRY